MGRDEGPGCQFSKLGQFRSLLYFSTSLKKGRLGGRHTSLITRISARIFLQQNLTRLLVRQNLTLYPLERVINRLGVAGQLLCHLFVGRSL